MVTEAKERRVARLRERFERTRGALLADFRGLDVSEMMELRRGLKANGAELQVVKNSLVRIALRETPFAMLEGEIDGPTSVTFFDGELALAARGLVEFGAAHPALEVRCGVYEGRLFGRQEVERIAKLPPREVLLAQLAGTLQSPVAGLARVLKGLIHKLVLTLAAVRDQRG